jgi:hypothetical protein
MHATAPAGDVPTANTTTLRSPVDSKSPLWRMVPYTWGENTRLALVTATEGGGSIAPSIANETISDTGQLAAI